MDLLLVEMLDWKSVVELDDMLGDWKDFLKETKPAVHSGANLELS